jgi:hypothetical protein
MAETSAEPGIFLRGIVCPHAWRAAMCPHAYSAIRTANDTHGLRSLAARGMKENALSDLPLHAVLKRGRGENAQFIERNFNVA